MQALSYNAVTYVAMGCVAHVVCSGQCGRMYGVVALALARLSLASQTSLFPLFRSLVVVRFFLQIATAVTIVAAPGSTLRFLCPTHLSTEINIRLISR